MPNTEITSENTTTTTTDKDGCCGGCMNLIFPKSLIPSQQRSISSLLSSYPNHAQQIVDELAGRMKVTEVKNPIGYVKGIVQNIGEDEFEPELALGVAEARAVYQKREAANREAQKKMESRDSVIAKSNISAKEQIANLRDILKKGGDQ